MNLLIAAVNRLLLLREIPTLEKRAKYVREGEIERLFRDGKTYEEIGSKFCITRERVRQILKKRGVKKSDGGCSLRRFEGIKKMEMLRATRRDERVKRRFGCDWETTFAICGTNSPTTSDVGRAYIGQVQFSKMRKIPWEFTLPTWWQVWRDSGNWARRGRGSDAYCMSRKNDKGPYSPTNVRICTNAENIRDGYKTRIWCDQYEKKSLLALDLRDGGVPILRIAKRLGIKSRSTVSCMISNARRWKREGLAA